MTARPGIGKRLHGHETDVLAMPAIRERRPFAPGRLIRPSRPRPAMSRKLCSATPRSAFSPCPVSNVG